MHLRYLKLWGFTRLSAGSVPGKRQFLHQTKMACLTGKVRRVAPCFREGKNEPILDISRQNAIGMVAGFETVMFHQFGDLCSDRANESMHMIPVAYDHNRDAVESVARAKPAFSICYGERPSDDESLQINIRERKCSRSWLGRTNRKSLIRSDQVSLRVIAYVYTCLYEIDFRCQELLVEA